MGPERLLGELNEQGISSGADYNDGLDGWFGWSVQDRVLTIEFMEGDNTTLHRASWILVEQHKQGG